MKIEHWEGIPFEKLESDVFHLQMRIFRASKIGQRETVHKLQRLLVSSFSARCLAVSKVTERNKGRQTAGVDGVRCLTGDQKFKLASELSLQSGVAPVKRVWIPKPGINEKRPLGIPTIHGRAQQALIVLALEPQWEALFETGSYGFRRGRRAHDVIVNIRSSIQTCPRWVLDADIEKFFDRVHHEALLKKLDTFPLMKVAIRRILKAGILEGCILSHPEEGTPQGGPLSPLLANVALHGMEQALTSVAEHWNGAQGRIQPPKVYRFADDFIVLHKDREVVIKCQEFLATWLREIGLNLHPAKTRITHTLEVGTGKPGFDFLGHTIRQFRTGKHAIKPYFKQVYTHITPSRASQKKVYDKAAEIIDKVLAGPAVKGDGKVRILIWQLNPLVRGWANYFQTSNAKEVFTRLDYLLWWKLWKRLRVRYRSRGREWIVKNHLRDGDGKWTTWDHDPSTGEKVVLRHFAETPIIRHFPVRSEKSFFDGDWAYWATRRGAYPGLPKVVGRLMKKQWGRCRHCRGGIDRHQVVDTLPEPVGSKSKKLALALVHKACASAFRDQGTQNVSHAISSPVR
jgi:RNA-directed DNA polymerase